MVKAMSKLKRFLKKFQVLLACWVRLLVCSGVFSAWIHESTWWISGKDRFTSTERFAMGHGILWDTVGMGWFRIEEPGNHLILWVPNFNQNANSFLSEATKGLGSHSVPWGLVQNPTGFMDQNAGALFTWKIADCDGCSFPPFLWKNI